MKNKLLFALFLSLLFLSFNEINAQKIWQKLEKNNFLVEKKDLYEKKNFPSEYEIVRLNVENFESRLQQKSTKQNIIELPNSNGILSRFIIKETSNFNKGLQAKFPNIKSYSAQGVDDPTAVAKISLGTDGFHAVIFSGKEETLYIDPYAKNNLEYILYNKSSLSKVEDDFKCQVEESANKELSITDFSKNANDGKLRTFRLALVCSGEYAQFHLGASQQNVPDTATDQVKKTAVLSAMNTSLTRLNGVFERDLSIKLELVANNDEVIFLDADTDGITDGNADKMIDEVQAIADNKIRAANYDIGHIFSTGGSGLAGLGVVCVNGQKARGVTGIASPVGDPYDIDFVAHEIGHQFGATHTQNNDCNRSSSTAVEPGSGSTIMGYAGICAPDVQSGNPNGNSDDYFHAVSIAQMWNVIQSSATCGVKTDTNNAAPTANAGLDYSIPKSTPFKLKGTATDADGVNSLTYNWEQLDNEVGAMPPKSTNSDGPMFRSISSKNTPVRYMPDLTTVVAGNTFTTWEVLPSVARELNFSFLVRDNNAGGGSTARDDMKIDVVDAEAFLVTTPNTAVNWDTGSTQTITWDKGTTDVAPINCAAVNIKLSIDGGLTFPITIKSNTPNDGTEDIIIPDNATTSARIMVEAADNIFYNINSTNFTINSTTPTFLINNSDGLQAVCNSGNQIVEYDLDFNFVNGFTENVSLAVSGEPTGSNVALSSSTIDADGNITLTLSNLDGLSAQDYEISVVGTSATVTQTIKLDFKLNSSVFNALTLTSPANEATNINLVDELKWNADANASSYDVEVATDVSFTNMVASGNVTSNLFITNNLSGTTQYFWRVKPKNNCGEGSFSDAFSFTTKVPVYCASTFTDEAGGSEHIKNVTFGGINNDSGNDTVDGYEDFTAINTDLSRGQNNQISVTIDTGGYQDHCYVFIDWNQDYIFDTATERYDLGTELEDLGTKSLNIIVPNDAKYGTTRMRVVIEYDDPNDNYGEGACDAGHLTEWGETEDYSITVLAPVMQPNNYVVITTSESCEDENDGAIEVKVNQSEFTYQVNITGPSTNISQNLTNLNYMLSSLTPGNYEVCITAQEVSSTHCFEVTIEESAQIALKVSSSKQAYKYKFDITKGSPPYEIYLNDDLISITSEKDFELEIKGSGKLEVKTAKDCEGLYKTSIGRILLKQNPVSDFIELILPLGVESTMIQASVFDVNGKMIYNKSIKKNNSSLQIPFKNYEKGLYILKLSLANSKPIKIIKQ